MIDTPFTDTRYTGKQYRDDELGEAAVQRANWRYVACGALALSDLLVLLLFYTVSLPRKIGVPFTVNEASGDVRIMEHDWQTFVPPESTYTKQLREDVEALRTISTDKEQMRRQHVKARLRLTKEGKDRYNQYMQERKPFDQKEPTTVDIIGTPLHEGGLTWDSRWRETTYGTQVVVETWRGKFTFKRVPPKDDEERAATPLGLFLDPWSWSKE